MRAERRQSEQGPGEGALLSGRYRLAERLAAGGMGTVFRAWDQHLRRPVAIKVIHPSLVGRAELRRRFLVEARAAAALQHPAVVSVYDHGEDEQPYIVMELVEGASLAGVLAECGHLTPAQVLTALLPVCDALSAAHEAGVIHRDIKLENVLVGRDGRTVKLVDFGLARLLDGSYATGGAAVLGTVHYLAPELVAGGPATESSDQYALGVMLSELLAGVRGQRERGMRRPGMRRPATPAGASGEVVEVDARLDDIASRATARRPADRYPDIAALAAALRDAVPATPAPLPLPEEPELHEASLSRRGSARGRTSGTDRPSRFSTVLRAPVAVVGASALLVTGLVLLPVELEDWPFSPGQEAPAQESEGAAGAETGAAGAGSPGSPGTAGSGGTPQDQGAAPGAVVAGGASAAPGAGQVPGEAPTGQGGQGGQAGQSPPAAGQTPAPAAPSVGVDAGVGGVEAGVDVGNGGVGVDLGGGGGDGDTGTSTPPAPQPPPAAEPPESVAPGTPPGHGGTPPGHGGTPPGHGGTPPGHGGTPPGQAKKSEPPP